VGRGEDCIASGTLDAANGATMRQIVLEKAYDT
jgi:hypothetical protein